jgi:hypothetical protein
MNRNGLIVLQALGSLSILAFPFVLPANIMSVAAPGQSRMGATALVLLSTYPLVWIALYVISWRAMARGAVGLAFGLSSIPLVPCLFAAGLLMYGWIGFMRGFQGPATDAQRKLEPANPLLWAVWSVGGENRFPAGPSLPADRALRAIDAHPSLVNVGVPPYGSPLKVAVENLSMNLDGMPIGYIPRQYELMNVVRVLVAHGARFGPGETANLRNQWLLRRALFDGPIATESENPLVWRILTRKRDGVTPFSMQPGEEPLLNKSTRLHGTPLYAALLQDAPDAYTGVIKAGGRLSAGEERDTATVAALEWVLARDFDLRRAYAKAP